VCKDASVTVYLIISVRRADDQSVDTGGSSNKWCPWVDNSHISDVKGAVCMSPVSILFPLSFFIFSGAKPQFIQHDLSNVGEYRLSFVSSFEIRVLVADFLSSEKV